MRAIQRLFKRHGDGMKRLEREQAAAAEHQGRERAKAQAYLAARNIDGPKPVIGLAYHQEQGNTQ